METVDQVTWLGGDTGHCGGGEKYEVIEMKDETGVTGKDISHRRTEEAEKRVSFEQETS
jgi:hypothetical protein